MSEAAQKIDPSILQERLGMGHLAQPETETEARAAAEAAQKKEEEKKEEKIDGRHEERWTFQFRWKDGRGKVWSGRFINEILSQQQRHQAAVMEARIRAGLSYDSFSPTQRDTQHITAHMSHSLVDRPEWAEDLYSLKDLNLLFRLWDEVASHEAMFFGLGKAEKGGQEKRSEG